MPYVTPTMREFLDAGTHIPATQGELNYVLTQRVMEYIAYHGIHYATINDVVGALECAKQEFYRRVAVPYEEGKRRANGDVYPNP